MRVLPPPDGRMSVISALRIAIFSTTVPEYSSSTSMMTVSYGSVLLAVLVLAEQHARAADAELEAFAAHRLDQHAELKLAAAGDFEAVLVGASVTLIATLRFGFAEQAVADHAAGHLGALAARHRRIVDREAHRQRRRIDRLGVERLGHARDRRSCWTTVAMVRPAIEMMSPAWPRRPARARARGRP